jgi:hypothetical protein
MAELGDVTRVLFLAFLSTLIRHFSHQTTIPLTDDDKIAAMLHYLFYQFPLQNPQGNILHQEMNTDYKIWLVFHQHCFHLFENDIVKFRLEKTTYDFINI